MNDRFSEENNFYKIRGGTILFWGLDIKEPFEVHLDTKIKGYIRNNNLPENEVCEIIDKIDIELYEYCLSIRNDLDENDARVVLMNRLISLGVKKDKALLIAIEAGASQILVDNSKYIEELGVNKNLKRIVLETLCDFYFG
ncbi:MAG: hypothetical protein J7J86_06680 [Bacteroidales bacterium]|nr:hypothetical protein [Bacteroidales bacterium]